jgi:hypothetical protein
MEACETTTHRRRKRCISGEDRENKEERLRKAREADRKKEKARKEAIFRSHAAAALEIEAAKK